MGLAFAGALDEGLTPIDADDIAGRTHVVGELVDAQATTACQVEDGLVVQAAGDEHLAATIEAACLGKLRVVCRKIVE